MLLCDIIEHNCFAADKEIHNLPIFDHPQHSANTERRSTIGVRLVVVREILTHK